MVPLNLGNPHLVLGDLQGWEMRVKGFPCLGVPCQQSLPRRRVGVPVRTLNPKLCNHRVRAQGEGSRPFATENRRRNRTTVQEFRV